MAHNRLQLPLGQLGYGSIKRITYPDGNVNTHSMQNFGNDANRQSLVTESSVAELYDGSVPDEELAERARVEAAEYLEAPYDAEEEAGRTAERFNKERDSFDTVLSGIDVSKLSDKKYLQSVSGNIVKATN